MTQQQLAQEIGVRFQQLQKYETGANRVSASRLWELGKALQAPIGFFFAELPGEGATSIGGFHEVDPLYERDSLELLRAYNGLSSELRSYVLDLLKALSGNADAPAFAHALAGQLAAAPGSKSVAKSLGKSARKTAGKAKGRAKGR